MSARINYVERNRRRNMPCERPHHDQSTVSAGAAAEEGAEHHHECECRRSVDFCETLTLHESFDASAVCSESATIAYDTSFLGYTVEELTMNAELPCGCSCPVAVQRISLTGAIPYIINVGSVSSGCGDDVSLSIQGSTMVDEVVGYTCETNDPELEEVSCENVTPCIDEVDVSPCGCSGKTNVTVKGRFVFSNLPVLC